jgi:hypothetical protein
VLCDSNVIGGVAGITADANSLVNFARTAAQRHLLQYNEDIPVELLAQRLCDMKQGYTQYGGTFPLGPVAQTLDSIHLSPQVSAHSVFLSFTLATIPITTSSSTIRIHRVITPAGRLPASVQTTARHRAY